MINQSIGKKGELIATNYLKDKGYTIKNNNYRVSTGEIDIIAFIDDILVFIEVKTRRNKKYGNAYESVDLRKQKKIIETALIYISEMKLNNVQIRFDIIEVYLIDGCKINHIENAFT